MTVAKVYNSFQWSLVNNQSNKPTHWKYDVCDNTFSSKTQLYKSKIDPILETVNTTNFKIYLLVKENKLLSYILQKIRLNSSAIDISDPIIINELYDRLSRDKNAIKFNVPDSILIAKTDKIIHVISGDYMAKCH